MPSIRGLVFKYILFRQLHSQEIWASAIKRDPHQSEFLTAVHEVLSTMQPVFEKKPEYIEVMKRIVEPERLVQFRVSNTDTIVKSYQLDC